MEFSSGMTDDLTRRFFLYDMSVFFLFFCFAQVQRSSRQRATQNAGAEHFRCVSAALQCSVVCARAVALRRFSALSVFSFFFLLSLFLCLACSADYSANEDRKQVKTELRSQVNQVNGFLYFTSGLKNF